MEENIIMITHPKTFYYNFDNLKHENEFIIKRNKSLVENKIKSAKLNNCCSNISLETIFLNTEKAKRINRINL